MFFATGGDDMDSELREYKIVQSDEDNTITVYKNERPLIKAVLTKTLSSMQLAAYWPMIRSRVERTVKVISDMTPKEIMVFLEDVNWLNGPITHFEYVGG